MDPTLVVPESSAARRQHTCRRCAGGVSLALPWPPRALAEALRTLERWLRSPLFPLQGPSGERGEQGAPGPSGFQVGSRTRLPLQSPPHQSSVGSSRPWGRRPTH